MQINTRYFGVVAYEKSETIYFPNGIYGFEEEKTFLPLPFEEENDMFLCLQSTQTSHLAFIIMNPFYILSDYSPVPSPEEKKMLNFKSSDEISYYVIVALKDNMEDSTVNLKAPLAVNIRNRLACQLILPVSEYTFRHPLKQFSHRKGENHYASTSAKKK